MASNENIDYCINGNWVRAVFSALPAWFRFAQCFRRYKDQKDTVHLVNAGKYSSTLIVVIFSFLNVYFNLHFAYSEVGSNEKSYQIWCAYLCNCLQNLFSKDSLDSIPSPSPTVKM